MTTFTTAGTDAVITIQGELTLRTARPVLQAVDDWLQRTLVPRSLVIDLNEVKACDVVGLALLSDVRNRCVLIGIDFSIVPSPNIAQALVTAHLVEALPAVEAPPRHAERIDVAGEAGGPPVTLARAKGLTLRLPEWEDLELFESWAADCILEELVGSHLLYSCRHQGAYHPDVAPRLLGDATSVTALLEIGGRDRPIGYVRLFGIDLVQRVAFLEVVVARESERQRGWGILAARMLIAWAFDVLKLHRVEAKAYARNRASNRALCGNGFTVEGVIREASTSGDGRDDLILYGILASEAWSLLARDAFPSFALWPSPS